jgi:hypothetical protein
MALQSTTAIATITLQQASSTVTFSGIPNTYRDLVLVTEVKASASGSFLRYIFNGDTTEANYSRVFALGNGSSTSSQALNNPYVGEYSTAAAVIVFNIMDYSATDKHKSLLIRSSNASAFALMAASRWANINAINSISLEAYTSNFTAGSTFSLYGRIA